jgi:uncharacterized OsmC-like protein
MSSQALLLASTLGLGVAIGFIVKGIIDDNNDDTENNDSSTTTDTSVETVNTKWKNNFNGKSPALNRIQQQVPTFISGVGQKKYRIVMEPGQKGKHIAPMQALLASAASCMAASLLKKLQKKQLIVDSLELDTTATRKTSIDATGNTTKDMFSSLSFHFNITSPNAEEKEVQKICKTHTCSVLRNLKVSSIKITAVVKDLIEI